MGDVMKLLGSVRFAGLLIAGVLLTGCATSPEPQIEQTWMEDILNYEASLGSDHPDSIENLFKVSPKIRSEVISKFSRMPDYLAARRMANWLVSAEGKAMTYDIEANLRPQQAYSENRGNCLSFTLLLLQLAHELGIELHANEVDLPDFWSENNTQKGIRSARSIDARPLPCCLAILVFKHCNLETATKLCTI